MRHTYGMQRAIKIFLPERQEAAELGKFGEQVVILPKVGLYQPAMIGTPIQNVRGRQAVAKCLFAEILGNHLVPLF